MADEFKDFELEAPAAPSLTFDAPQEATEAQVQVMEAPKVEQPKAEEVHLTPEEMTMVENFAKQIDVNNSQAIMNYGAGTQKKMADFSEKAIGNVRSKDMGEVGDMISGLVTELKSHQAD